MKGLRCFACDDTIWSRHRHDFRYCKCGKVFVDGGRDYFRYGWETDAKFEMVDVKDDSQGGDDREPT